MPFLSHQDNQLSLPCVSMVKEHGYPVKYADILLYHI